MAANYFLESTQGRTRRTDKGSGPEDIAKLRELFGKTLSTSYWTRDHLVACRVLIKRDLRVFEVPPHPKSYPEALQNFIDGIPVKERDKELEFSLCDKYGPSLGRIGAILGRLKKTQHHFDIQQAGTSDRVLRSTRRVTRSTPSSPTSVVSSAESEGSSYSGIQAPRSSLPTEDLAVALISEVLRYILLHNGKSSETLAFQWDDTKHQCHPSGSGFDFQSIDDGGVSLLEADKVRDENY
ncbi:hypothetical protein CTA2_5735 [Colletotrichum tanaceti]|nr:hypothetical protein CTA2_5714 [Colletotrichum tanaceti]KAJ0168980.1 hypothetical protein CTA2_5735 [Colletotrichum tanaceti]